MFSRLLKMLHLHCMLFSGDKKCFVYSFHDTNCLPLNDITLCMEIKFIRINSHFDTIFKLVVHVIY